ncbi:carboxypeptidase-like regulatory domain-containing protein [Smaragdicoccus niigatensis]
MTAAGHPVISGEVVSDDGFVVGAAVLFAHAPFPTPDIAALTDDRGRFRLPSVGSGHYCIAVNAAGSALVRHEFDVAADDVWVTVRI